MMDERDWYEDLSNIANLLEWLMEQDEAPTGTDLVYMLRKPWKWAAEYQAMVAAQVGT
jgi:hypothetical protein